MGLVWCFADNFGGLPLLGRRDSLSPADLVRDEGEPVMATRAIRSDLVTISGYENREPTHEVRIRSNSRKW